jgi:alpha-tubulin suppressor-like RCC1 family protein
MLKRPPGTGRLRAGPLAASTSTSHTARPGRTGRRVVLGLLVALMAQTCLLTAAGVASASSTSPSTLYSWGSNSYGELGDGTTTSRVSPEPTSLAPGAAPTSLSAGVGFALAIGSDGNLYAWGTGYLGDGSGTHENSPERITLAPGVTPTAISAGGDDFSLAIGSDGNLYAWGSDSNGQLGDKSTGGDVESPERITLAPGVTPIAISAGYSSSLAIGSDRNLYAWGSNGTGQLGDRSTTPDASPEVVSLPAGVKATAIAEGDGTSYAIGSDGNLYAWGDNQFGQLGGDDATGPTTCGADGEACAISPIKVTVNVGNAQDPELAPLQATAVAASEANWGALAIGADGDLYQWGLNFSCGGGQAPDAYSPQVVTLASGVLPTAISTSECDDYAIGSDGNLYGWGWNVDGELGDGATSPETNPEKISLAPGVSPTAIAGNYNYALAIGTSATTGATPAEIPGSKAPLAAAPDPNNPPAAAPATVDPPAGLPETPFAVGLPVLAAAILAGGLFIARRRGRRTSSIT